MEITHNELIRTFAVSQVDNAVTDMGDDGMDAAADRLAECQDYVIEAMCSMHDALCTAGNPTFEITDEDYQIEMIAGESPSEVPAEHQPQLVKCLEAVQDTVYGNRTIRPRWEDDINAMHADQGPKGD